MQPRVDPDSTYGRETKIKNFHYTKFLIISCRYFIINYFVTKYVLNIIDFIIL